mmetsp:Transcript_5028/g.4261  ORF Transcript_5028/g.4261 Transcript_5028/m.4261 type:complete len:104 (+) Transcript_5028:249-560(+)
MVAFSRSILYTATIPDFKQMVSSFNSQSISFDVCGYSGLNNWRDFPERFENLVKGLAAVEDVRKNLKRIWMINCGLEPEDIREILDRNGFSDIVIHFGIYETY